MSAEDFRQLQEAQSPLAPQNLNGPLLTAAVFHETNRQRAKHGLSPLRHSGNADKAAEFHAQIMARDQFVAHTNPEPDRETLSDRAKLAGINPQFVAENVAMTFAIRYESGKPVYPRQENGKMVFSYEPGGEPIRPHTYLTFAEALVGDWMNSPSHRENILQPKAEYFGYSGSPAKAEIGMDVIYSVQVFYAPMRSNPR
ncbi:MAG: CAP domain-containing protein [Limisphaerales bacterium]